MSARSLAYHFGASLAGETLEEPGTYRHEDLWEQGSRSVSARSVEWNLRHHNVDEWGADDLNGIDIHLGDALVDAGTWKVER